MFSGLHSSLSFPSCVAFVYGLPGASLFCKQHPICTLLAGHTPLHLAAAQQHPLMVHALLLAGAQHSAKDTQGW